VRRAWAADRAKEGIRTPTEGNADLMGDRSARRRRYQFFGSGWVERLCFIVLPRLLFLSYLGLAIVGLAQTSTKDCPGRDFVLSWAASSLALNGRPQDVYVSARLSAAERAAVHNDELGYTCWPYPPTFIVVDLPLGLISYRWSLLVWLLATLAAYCAVILAIIPNSDALWIALAFPGTPLNALAGQNGFLTTALFGAGLVLLRKKPIRAGVMFGLLTFKPQIGLLVPLALIATRRWRTFAAAASTAIAFAAISLTILGIGTWAAFFRSVPVLVHQLLENGDVGFGKMQSVFAGIRLLGFGPSPAYAAQTFAALISGTIVVSIWLAHRVPFEIKAAALAAATPLVSPYVMDYDLVVLALPIAWMVRDGMRRGFLSWEKPILFMTWLLPLFARRLALTESKPLAPIVITILLACIARRAAFFSRERGIGDTRSFHTAGSPEFPEVNDFGGEHAS
jgi:alpha-1,2-mannosyltransferase